MRERQPIMRHPFRGKEGGERVPDMWLHPRALWGTKSGIIWGNQCCYTALALAVYAVLFFWKNWSGFMIDWLACEAYRRRRRVDGGVARGPHS